MPSRKNPNKPSKNRLASRAGGIKKEAQRKSLAGQTRITPGDALRGRRVGLMANSGAGAPLSAKKQKKVDQRLRLALKRKMEAEGEVEMKDAPAPKVKAVVEEAAKMDIE
ncbi:hypothetical protein B0T25DRAFT_99039 [Lasiosphaeria hispida]|uniref:Ribosome biogenesis protein ALB1 n=1 Tax=Lasiosphaeria hispida TaxID=260671 RepID=A0AAJ0HQH7_9PEZI|nr:hypothetical protein B0T25DRAFT_99039 [Lasiosphaeria hispida]